MKQKEFHDLLCIDDAKKRFYKNIFRGPKGTERIDVKDAIGRILSCDIASNIDVPPFARSQRDGYAVIARDTFPADEENPVKLKLTHENISAGNMPKTALKKGYASRIATGAPIPRGANAVVMVEYCTESNGIVEVQTSVHPNEYIMHAGEDVMQGEVVYRRGMRISSCEIGVLAAIGITEIPVFSKPKIAVISTGNELVACGDKLAGAKIYDVNSAMIMAACKECGTSPDFLGIAKDNEKEIETLLEKALKYDAIIISGGTSAGAGDICHHVIDNMLTPGILVHGVAVKPGKPVVLGAHKKKPVIVLPGFPTSCIVMFNLFMKPLLLEMCGIKKDRSEKIKAKCAVRYSSSQGKHEFVLSDIVKGQNNAYYAYPVPKTSGAVTSFSSADGYIEIAEDIEYIEKEEVVDVVLLSDEVTVPDIVFIGSQCMGSDAALTILSKRGGYLSRVINVGSTGGILACRRGEADICGTHLIDAKSGVYNISFMDKELMLIRGYRRKQGIICRSDCRDKKSLDDFLSDENLMFINRNGGSGTRVLFDMLLSERKYSSKTEKIKGYDIESKSHNAVACAVAAKKADWGIGIYSAAKMYNLKFIDLRDEEYDFCIPKSRFKKKSVQEFISVLKSDEFKKRIEALGGFVIPPDIGEIVYGKG